jgi:hypothetical protein
MGRLLREQHLPTWSHAQRVRAPLELAGEALGITARSNQDDLYAFEPEHLNALAKTAGRAWRDGRSQSCPGRVLAGLTGNTWRSQPLPWRVELDIERWKDFRGMHARLKNPGIPEVRLTPSGSFVAHLYRCDPWRRPAMREVEIRTL